MRALLACAACLLTPATALAQTSEHTISVLGTGQVEVRPDRGSFSVAVSRIARTGNRARGRANARTEAIVRGLRRAGVGEDDLTTSSVSISRERYRPRKDAPQRTRFRAHVTLRVAVDGLGRLGRAIDAASRRGATEIYGPQLSFSPERRADGERRSASAALDDARARAEAAAAQEGQRIVDVQSIDLDPGQGQYAPFAFNRATADSGAGSSAPTRIRSALRKVTSRARVTYVIERVG
jgi:uncharacterized protein